MAAEVRSNYCSDRWGRGWDTEILMSYKNESGAHLWQQQDALIRSRDMLGDGWVEGRSYCDIAVVQEWKWCPPMAATGHSN